MISVISVLQYLSPLVSLDLLHFCVGRGSVHVDQARLPLQKVGQAVKESSTSAHVTQIVGSHVRLQPITDLCRPRRSQRWLAN